MSQDNTQYGDKTGKYAFTSPGGTPKQIPKDNKGRIVVATSAKERSEPEQPSTTPNDPGDGILFRARHPGTNNVNTEQNLAAWFERGAIHRQNDDWSEKEVALHAQTIRWLAANKPKLLGKAWAAYKSAAQHLPALVKNSGDAASVYSSKRGSRPLGPHAEKIAALVKPLVGVANTLLSQTTDAKGNPLARPLHGAAFEPFDAHDPDTVPEKLPAPKKAIDEPVARVDARKTVKAGKDKEQAEDKKAREHEPTIDNEQPAIPLAPGPNERGGRFATIHAMVRDGHPKESVIAALQKEPHGLTATQASATFRRWLRSESARRMIEQEQRESEAHRARGHLKLARALHPDEHADHDAFVAASREAGGQDNNALSPFGDWLEEHEHPNARLVQAAATRGPSPLAGGGPYPRGIIRGPEVWLGPGGDPHTRTFGPPTTIQNMSTGERAGNSSAAAYSQNTTHVYEPQVFPDGRVFVNLVHRAALPFPGSSVSVPAHGAAYMHVPVKSRADLDHLTEELHPEIRRHLHTHLDAHLPEHNPTEGPHKLARPAGEKPVTLDEMTKSGVIGGTALEYHLKHLVKNGDAAVSNAARAALKLDRDRDLRGARDLMNVQDPYAYLGRLLKDRGHKLADAYNWSSMKDSLERDRMVEKMFAGTRARFSGGDHAFWDRMTRQMNDPKKAAVWDQVLSRLGAGHTKEQVAASIHRIADRHLDREYLSAVKEDVAARTRADKAVKQTPMLPAAHTASEEANAERDALTGPGSQLHWRTVTGRLPAKAPLRFSRAWGNES